MESLQQNSKRYSTRISLSIDESISIKKNFKREVKTDLMEIEQEANYISLGNSKRPEKNRRFPGEK